MAVRFTWGTFHRGLDSKAWTNTLADIRRGARPIAPRWIFPAPWVRAWKWSGWIIRKPLNPKEAYNMVPA